MAHGSTELIAIETDVKDHSLVKRAHTLFTISDFPTLIIDHILDSMPMRDAARTSILSRKWRYMWASHPTIILDPKCIRVGQVVSQDDYMKIITRLFFQHLGPIHNFSLKFPIISTSNRSPDYSFYPYVDHVLMFLSRNGIREITLENTNDRAYTLPSYLFSVPQLSHLTLTGCIFKSPNNFQGFHGLTYLKLVRISFLLSSAASVLGAPRLECLILSTCTGARQFKVSAPKLRTLYICNNDDVDLSGFLISKHLQTAIVAVSVEKPLFNRIDVTKLFKSWPLISWLCIDGPTLMCLAADLELQKLPTTCRSLKHLVVQRVKFGDIHQIALILCLLRSSPLLTKLEISVDISEKNATEAVSNYLSEDQRSVGTMDNLQTVTIGSFIGTKAEILFVKLLLSCSPRLNTIAVQESSSTSLTEKFSISKQLMQLSRASKEAVIVYEPDIKMPVYDDGLFSGLF